MALQGKPVMLYFSQARQEPDRIDLDQLRQLREFKDKTFPKALVEHYSTQIDFRDKLAKQIEIQLRSLLAAEVEGTTDALAARPITDIQLAFGDPETGAIVGAEMPVRSTFYDVTDLDSIPDYIPATGTKKKSSNSTRYTFLGGDTDNKDYYREMVQYIKRVQFFRPVRFWLKNTGAVGARDVYVDIRIEGGPQLAASTMSGARLVAPSASSGGHILNWGTLSTRDDSSAGLDARGSAWSTYLELSALQPQREVSPPPQFVLGLETSAKVTFTARIYADTLPEPVTRTLTLDWVVERKTSSALNLLREYGELSEPAVLVPPGQVAN